MAVRPPIITQKEAFKEHRSKVLEVLRKIRDSSLPSRKEILNGNEENIFPQENDECWVSILGAFGRQSGKDCLKST